MPDQQAARDTLIAARQAREDAEPRWRSAILAALAAGIGPVEVAKLGGCTRQRVFQIQQETRRRR